MRGVVLIENGTRIVLDFEIGPGDERSSEQALARPIMHRLKSGTLNLADRLYPGKDAWDQASATGAQLLWRVKKDIRLDPIQIFKDKSYLAYFCSDAQKRKRDQVMGDNQKCRSTTQKIAA